MKRQVQEALGPAQKNSAKQLAALKAEYRAIDEAHTAALWARVRDLFDYPVFVAAPKTVGITSTGETGEGVANELGAVLNAYRAFDGWCSAGEPPDAMPEFAA